MLLSAPPRALPLQVSPDASDLTSIAQDYENNKIPAKLRAQLTIFRGVALQQTTGDRKKIRPIAIPDVLVQLACGALFY
jgi:hypothetical protein